MTHVFISDHIINNVIRDLEAENAKSICKCGDMTLRFLKSSLMYCEGKCIQNAFGFVKDLKLNGNPENVIVIEGLAISPQGYLFKHMWNRIIVNDQEYDIDVTAELFMKRVQLKYYPILEYSNVNTDINRKFSKLTTSMEKRYWYFHPTSKQHNKEQKFTKSNALYINEFIKKFPQLNNIYNKLVISWSTSCSEAFCVLGNLIEICEAKIEKYQLSLDECLACIAHEIGHIFDSTPKDEAHHEERELNADKKVIELGLQEHLISALKKLCIDDTPEHKLLTDKRIKTLEESLNK